MKVITKYYDQIRIVYILYITMYWILRMILPITDSISSIPFLLVLVLLSVIVAVIDIFGERRMLNAEYGGLIAIYILWGLISLSINHEYGIWDGLVAFGFFAFQFMILYGTTPKTIEAIKKEVYIIFNVICILSFVIALLGIVTFIFEIDFWAYKNGIAYSQGFSFQYGRAWGVLASANLHTGTFALISILLSMIIIQWEKKYIYYILHGVNIIVQVVMLVLSGSRSSILAGGMCVLVIGWYYSKRLADRISEKKLLQQIFRIGIGGCCLIIALVMISLTTSIVPYVQQIGGIEGKQKVQEWGREKIEKIYKNGGFEIAFNNVILEGNEKEGSDLGDITKKDEEIAIRQDIEEKEDTSNGRLEMWKEAGQIFLEHPIIGIGNNNLGYYVEKEHNDFVINSFGHCHNTYIEIIVCNGIVGFFVLFLFFFFCAWKCLQYQEDNYENRKIVGGFLGIIVVLAIVIFFSEDIFFQMSFNSIIFWLTLGYIVKIVYLDKVTANTSKYAFVCETGLHLFNSLKIILGDLEGEVKNSDIYIYHQFQHSKKYAQEIKKLGIVNNVYEFEKYTNVSGWKSKLQTIQRLITNVATLKRFSIGTEDYLNKRYQVICVGMITQFSNNIKALSYEAKCYFIEDGIGSYYIDLENEEMTVAYRFVNKYLLAEKLSYHPERIYLNSPQAVIRKNINMQICQIPQIDGNENMQSKIQQVFSYKENNIYKKKKVVYLSQPLIEVHDARIDIEFDILNTIAQNSRDDLIVRVHPRQKAEIYKEYFRDEINNLWELECEKQITDEHILISAFSTAQVMPKLLRGKEPTIIFLFKIFGCYDDCMKIVEKMVNMYQNKEKIYIPESINELERIIKKLT